MQLSMDEELPSAAPASGGSSDDSDSDFEEVEASAEDMELITSLEAELSANPNLYDKHVEVRRRVHFNLRKRYQATALLAKSVLQALPLHDHHIYSCLRAVEMVRKSDRLTCLAQQKLCFL